MSTPAQNIVRPTAKTERSLSSSVANSPLASFNSPPASYGAQQRKQVAEKHLKPFNTQDIKILLLENVNATGIDILKGQGYQVESLKTSLPEDKLIEKIKLVFTRYCW